MLNFVVCGRFYNFVRDGTPYNDVRKVERSPRIRKVERSPRIFGSLFLTEIFEKVSFDPYNFRITWLSARKSEQMKNF